MSLQAHWALSSCMCGMEGWVVELYSHNLLSVYFTVKNKQYLKQNDDQNCVNNPQPTKLVMTTADRTPPTTIPTSSPVLLLTNGRASASVWSTASAVGSITGRDFTTFLVVETISTSTNTA